MKKIISMLLLLIVTSTSYQVLAAENDKPFAEEKVVLQISDADPFKQTLVLNVANNLIKHYGQDKVEIEIVAFGPGLRLLFKDNVNSGRIDGLNASGAPFAACQNTVAAITKTLGHPPVLTNNATPVPHGPVRLIDFIKEGLQLVKT